MTSPQFNRLLYGLAAGCLALSQVHGLPHWLTAMAAVISATLAGIANAEHLPGVGPMIAARRAVVREAASAEMAAVAPVGVAEDPAPKELPIVTAPIHPIPPAPRLPPPFPRDEDPTQPGNPSRRRR